MRRIVAVLTFAFTFAACGGESPTNTSPFAPDPGLGGDWYAVRLNNAALPYATDFGVTYDSLLVNVLIIGESRTASVYAHYSSQTLTGLPPRKNVCGEPLGPATIIGSSVSTFAAGSRTFIGSCGTQWVTMTLRRTAGDSLAGQWLGMEVRLVKRRSP